MPVSRPHQTKITNPIRYSLQGFRRFRRRCRLNRPNMRSYFASARLRKPFGRSCFKKFGLTSLFAPAKGRPSEISRRLGCSWDRFRGREKRGFSCCFVAHTRSVLTSCEMYEKLHWLTKIEVQACHDRIKNRRNIDTNAVRAYARVRRGLLDGSERRLDHLGLPTWRPR